jgi:hypothetical protein
VCQKLISYLDLKPVVRDRFKEYLRVKEIEQGLILPSSFEGKMSFESLFNPESNEGLTFSLIASVGCAFIARHPSQCPPPAADRKQRSSRFSARRAIGNGS